MNEAPLIGLKGYQGTMQANLHGRKQETVNEYLILICKNVLMFDWTSKQHRSGQTYSISYIFSNS